MKKNLIKVGKYSMSILLPKKELVKRYGNIQQVEITFQEQYIEIRPIKAEQESPQEMKAEQSG